MAESPGDSSYREHYSHEAKGGNPNNQKHYKPSDKEGVTIDGSHKRLLE